MPYEYNTIYFNIIMNCSIQNDHTTSTTMLHNSFHEGEIYCKTTAFLQSSAQNYPYALKDL